MKAFSAGCSRLSSRCVLFEVVFLDAGIFHGYGIWADRYLISVGIPSNWTLPAMSVGQFSEIGTMAILGACLSKLGWKTTMIIGVLGNTLRFALFAFLPHLAVFAHVSEPWIAVAANIVHGICCAFFFTVVYIFIDAYLPKDARSSSQGLFDFLFVGVAQSVGFFLWPWLGESVFVTADHKPDYHRMLLVPAATGVLAALIPALFYYPPKKATSDTDVETGEASP